MSRTYDDGQLAAAVAAAHSWRGVLRDLGLPESSAGALRRARRRAVETGLDYSHFTGQRRWTEAQLAHAISTSRSWKQVQSALGLAGGSSTTLLKGHAARLGLDAAHLGALGRPATQGTPRPIAELEYLGRSAPLLAASWFTLQGHAVSWPLEPSRYDLLVAMDDQLARVQVKTTTVRVGDTWKVHLSANRSGRTVYDPDEIDYFFVIDGGFGLYLLPVATVGGFHLIHLSAYAAYRVPGFPTG
ncbi:MAG: group I intron-associated PD-(D/E)XK endonuclease [Sporichthyaceae bacterium]